MQVNWWCWQDVWMTTGSRVALETGKEYFLCHMWKSFQNQVKSQVINWKQWKIIHGHLYQNNWSPESDFNFCQSLVIWNATCQIFIFFVLIFIAVNNNITKVAWIIPLFLALRGHEVHKMLGTCVTLFWQFYTFEDALYIRAPPTFVTVNFCATLSWE